MSEQITREEILAVYPTVAKTIADLGYTGYVSHEYRPAPGRDAKESLKQAIEIMTV